MVGLRVRLWERTAKGLAVCGRGEGGVVGEGERWAEDERGRAAGAGGRMVVGFAACFALVAEGTDGWMGSV